MSTHTDTYLPQRLSNCDVVMNVTGCQPDPLLYGLLCNTVSRSASNTKSVH